MQITPLDPAGLLEIVPRKIGDERGYFSEIFRAEPFQEHAGKIDFVQDNQSLSVKAGTIRGIHFQTSPAAQGKLVRCLSGAVFDVAVDLRHDSPTFGRWASVVLTPELNNQLWVPVGFGHAFCTLLPDSVVAYRVTDYYNAGCDKGLAWNDPAVGIEWPEIADPQTLSGKDRAQPALTDLPPFFSIGDR
ncbi:dTDP-4-dehydrorhamnose 3,5-epimerase [Sphingomonas glaciei]|uniref:dTDP-4-dehydrorhamnose 3,5-epimerase n=1 Tax=Sphingomonas glaciei TaxID=2938948 RepID=A0ABY5MUC3_9SPHN|nr:dTDP-4-dehydrorhamnose 3,5-epimerase [Sphingomonas glaciei]UUR08098.1 dTDP-4-dehydrorhamnose 3,5-epimerase [Sphingomonas glaciei]